MLGYKVLWESVGEFYDSLWYVDIEIVQVLYEIFKFFVEKRKLGKSVDIVVMDCGILFNEKVKFVSECVGFKDIIFWKVNVYYKDGE